MHTSHRRFVVESHGDIDSTQTRMRARIEAGEDVHCHVVRAERQLAGAGTRGRRWSSERGGSYQTVAFDPDRMRGAGLRGAAATPVADQASHDPHAPRARALERRLDAPGVTVAIGVGIATELADRGAAVRLKWPNDLYLDGRKLGGILSEVVRGWLLIGVGVNVANEPPPGGGALHGWELDAAHEAVLGGVWRGLELWTGGTALEAPFASVDVLAGRNVAIRTAGSIARGVASGVTADGALRLGDRVIADGSVAEIDGRTTSERA